jgi:hypothetical protein
LGEQLEPPAWETKAETGWTDEDRAAYEEWKRGELAAIRNGAPVTYAFMTAEEAQAASLQPHGKVISWTLEFDREA